MGWSAFCLEEFLLDSHKLAKSNWTHIFGSNLKDVYGSDILFKLLSFPILLMGFDFEFSYIC